MNWKRAMLLGCLLVASMLPMTARAESGSGNPKPATRSRAPEVAIYTAPWCASCRSAAEYLTRNGIPFTTKDVSGNPELLEEMSLRYRSTAVPLIVIGKDQAVLRGFVQEAFQRAYRDAMSTRTYAAARGGR